MMKPAEKAWRSLCAVLDSAQARARRFSELCSKYDGNMAGLLEDGGVLAYAEGRRRLLDETVGDLAEAELLKSDLPDGSYSDALDARWRRIQAILESGVERDDRRIYALKNLSDEYRLRIVALQQQKVMAAFVNTDGPELPARDGEGI